jgi:hypothetical protein
MPMMRHDAVEVCPYMLYRGVGRARASVSSVDGVGGWQWDEFAGTTICSELANRLRWYPNARAFVDVRR